jgi:hypothetical protein
MLILKAYGFVSPSNAENFMDLLALLTLKANGSVLTGSISSYFSGIKLSQLLPPNDSQSLFEKN